MRQITKLEAIHLQQNLHPLIIGVFSESLENYVFPKLKLHWTKSNDSNLSFLLLKDGNLTYLLQNNNNTAMLFILLPEISSHYIPLKKDIEKTINKLNISDQLVWFNEWWYLPSNAINLKEKITQWFNEENSIQQIQEKTLELTGLDENKVKYLLSSHYLLSGSPQMEKFLST